MLLRMYLGEIQIMEAMENSLIIQATIIAVQDINLFLKMEKKGEVLLVICVISSFKDDDSI